MAEDSQVFCLRCGERTQMLVPSRFVPKEKVCPPCRDDERQCPGYDSGEMTAEDDVILHSLRRARSESAVLASGDR